MGGFAHVAIDGPAGSGKTTVAQALAHHLGTLYLDTGAMYRAVALLALRSGTDPQDAVAMERLTRERAIAAEPDPAAPQGFRMVADGCVLGDALYANDVSRAVSAVAAHAGVRGLLVERQRSIARERAVIMAGRDIGTVVLPEAPFKFFLTASLDERVERRFIELAARGTLVAREVLEQQMRERDELDSTRSTSPLRRAPDALEIDSTGLSVDAVVACMADVVRA